MVADAAADRLWSLVQGKPYVIDRELVKALAEAASWPQSDPRTRLLIRDSYRALEKRWGPAQLSKQLSTTALSHIEQALSETDDRGFSTLERRIVEELNPEVLLRLFREVGFAVREPTVLHVGGSSALILSGHLRRMTEDVDVVDQLPDSIRNDHELLHRLIEKFGIQLTHFQSHYLPDGWRTRVHSLERFGQLDVFLVDVYDVAIGKFFSRRDKDFKDLQTLLPALDLGRLSSQFVETGKSLLSDEKFRSNAEKNWYVLFGTPLPS